MKKIIYLFGFFAAFFALSSCNDSKDEKTVIRFFDLETPGKELTGTLLLPVTTTQYDIDIQGGTGVYSYGPQDTGTVKVTRVPELSGTVLRVTPLKEGSTSIYILDSDMNSGRLFLSVTTYTLNVAVAEDDLEVDVTTPGIKTQIEAEMESLRLKSPMAVTFKYKTEQSGTLEVFPDKSNTSIKYDGTFQIRTVIGGTYIDMTYNGKMHTYKMTAQGIGDSGSSDVEILLEADLTNIYQTQYPTDGVQKVVATARLTN